jgi:hypothetical protein
MVIGTISNYLPIQHLITGFIAKMEDVYCAVRAECINMIAVNPSQKITILLLRNEETGFSTQIEKQM